MKVLMFGWEFPPFSSGGLGTACFGLTKGLKNNEVDVVFVTPKVLPKEGRPDHVELLSAYDKVILKNNSSVSYSGYEHLSEHIEVDSPLVAYMDTDSYSKVMRTSKGIINNISEEKTSESFEGEASSIYGKDLFHEVWRYKKRAGLIATSKDFDVIHCHDWMTYGAGIEAKKVSGKPLVVHIHATEFDRTANNPNPSVYNIEKDGFMAADKILAVSNYTRNRVINDYGIDPSKVEVVHNAVEHRAVEVSNRPLIDCDDKIVLFLGRLTVQKGPDWFLQTAKKVLDYNPDVTFIVAGSGDMGSRMIHQAAEMGLADKVLFAGFLRGADIDRAYKMADLYVMPSISEPFGITPLESMRNGTPTLISKQSGVSEVVKNCLKADFWDIDSMADKILSTLEYKPLQRELHHNGLNEVRTFNWDIPASKCLNAYNYVIELANINSQIGTKNPGNLQKSRSMLSTDSASGIDARGIINRVTESFDPINKRGGI